MSLMFINDMSSTDQLSRSEQEKIRFKIDELESTLRNSQSLNRQDKSNISYAIYVLKTLLR